MAGLASKFDKGDIIEVTDDETGYVVAQGEAMQSRGFTGLAEFQVLMPSGWARTYNLNFVTVKVVG